MLRIPRDYSFEYIKTSFKCHIEHKFNFIISDGANGKTYLKKQIIKSGNDGEIISLYAALKFIDFSKEYPCLFFIDETEFPVIYKKVGIATLQKTPNVFLIVSRNIPTWLSVDYRAVYDWVANNRKYTLKRKWPNYREFIESDSYLIEDSNSAFQYFQHRFQGYDVIPAGGKDKILKMVLKKDRLIVADGSAFARVMQKLSSIEYDCNLFLPDSFEGLILESQIYADSYVSRAYSDEVLNYKSIEEFYFLLAKEVFGSYSKKQLPSWLYSIDLLDAYNKRHLKDKLSNAISAM